jgi:hypothetical protein
MHAKDLRSAELNMLFQYHKCSIGFNLGLDIFCENNSHNIVHWNPAYKHWKEMQTWELREWFSLFYVEWIQEWIQSQYQVPEDFLKIINTDLLYDTEPTLIKIINHCGLTLDGDLSSFVTKWQRAQQYIVDEFGLLDEEPQNIPINPQIKFSPEDPPASKIFLIGNLLDQHSTSRVGQDAIFHIPLAIFRDSGRNLQSRRRKLLFNAGSTFERLHI